MKYAQLKTFRWSGFGGMRDKFDPNSQPSVADIEW